MYRVNMPVYSKLFPFQKNSNDNHKKYMNNLLSNITINIGPCIR